MAGPDQTPTQTHPWMGAMFGIAGLLVLGIGGLLFVAPDRTASYFPWTIEPPITAGFMGANYLAAAWLQIWAAREKRWSDARVAFPGVFIFTAATAFVSAFGLRRMAWHGPPLAFASCVAWVGVYFLVPLVWGWIWLKQPPRETPTRPGALEPAAVMLAICSAVLLAATGLVFIPSAWPWELTTPSSAYIGSMGMEPYIAAWLLGLGIVALMGATHPAPRRLVGVWNAAIALAVLNGVTMLRFRESVAWDRPGAWVMCGVLAVLFLAGLAARMSRITEVGRSR